MVDLLAEFIAQIVGDDVTDVQFTGPHFNSLGRNSRADFFDHNITIAVLSRMPLCKLAFVWFLDN